MAQIYDTRPVALVSLLSDHLWAESFLHLGPINKFWSSDVALAILLTIAVRMLLACSV